MMSDVAATQLSQLRRLKRGLMALQDLSTRIVRGIGCLTAPQPQDIFIEETAFHQAYWRQAAVPLPPEITVELTSRCDLRCATCSLSYRKDRGEDMTFDVFEKLLEQTREFCGSYNLHGIGESLLHPDLVRCIERVKDCRALCRITTNGLKLVPDLSRQIVDAGMDSVTFSVDAGTPETYRKIRRSNSFKDLFENIRALADVRAQVGFGRPRITTAFVATRENVQELPIFLDWSNDAGVDSVFVQCYEDRGWGDEHRLSKEGNFLGFLEEAEEMAKHLDLVFEYEYPARMAIETGRVSAQESPVWDSELPYVGDTPRYSACEATWVHGIVRANGDVDTCWFGETLGNIKESTFIDIWNGPAIREFRQRQRSFTDPPPPCCARARGWHYCNTLRDATDSIAIGPGDHPQLGLGWHVRQDEKQFYFRFTDSSAVVFLKNTGKPYLALRLCVYPTSKKQARTVDISVGSLSVGSVSVDNAWREYIVRLPPLRDSFIKVTLTVDRFVIPCRTSASSDFRRLGVAVSLVALRSTRWPGWTF